MEHRSQRSSARTLAAAAALGIILSAQGMSAAEAAPPSAEEKLSRQIEVMSGILNQVLLDSPNFLVRSGDNVTSFHLQDYGAIFAFDASLTDQYFDGNVISRVPDGIEIRKEDGGRTIILKHRHSSNDKGKDADDEAEGKDPAKLYAAGKEELIQMLIDYAETMPALPSGQSVVIVANVKNDKLWGHRTQHLQVRVSGDDLKSFASDRISQNDLKNRIRAEEY